MRKGIVKITSEFLMGGIRLPSHWEIESIHMEKGAYAEAVISGPEFPEVSNGGLPKECEILVTKHKKYSFEVKEQSNL